MYSKLALPAAALLQLASAQILIGTDTDKVTTEDWQSVIESANYTDVQTVAGKDVSASYPGSSQDGWEFRFALKDGIDSTTAGAISLTGPDSDFDDSWHLCLHVLPIRAASAGSGWSTDFDGTCSGSIASECLEDLKNSAKSSFDKDCTAWTETPSCQRDILEGTSSVVSVTADNYKDFIGNETSFYREVFGSQSEPTDALVAVLEPRAVISVWGYSADSGDEPAIEVTCLRPDTVESGSTDPAEPASGASGIAAFASWAVLSAAVAFQMLL